MASSRCGCEASVGYRLRATFGEDADQVHHEMGVAHGCLDRGGVTHVGLHRVDLADQAHRLQVAGQFRPPHRDPDAVVALGQRPHYASPNKTRSAENRNQGIQIRGHGFYVLQGRILREWQRFTDSR